MKKILLLTFVAAFVLNISLVQAAEPKVKKSDNKETVAKTDDQKLSDEEIQKLVARVDEINAMDKKALTPQERRALRKEVRDIKDLVNKNADGIYIGGGALLVVIVLLILFL